MESENKINNTPNGNADKEKIKKRSKPNIFSRIFLWWICPVLITGNRRDVEEDDLIIPSKNFDSDTQGDYFER